MNNIELISIGENSKELFLKKDKNDISKLLENVKKLKDETKNILKLDPDYTNVKNVIDEIDSLGVNFKYMLDSYSEYYKNQHDGLFWALRYIIRKRILILRLTIWLKIRMVWILDLDLHTYLI